MADFNPPIAERDTKELITIAHSSTAYWQQEAITKAKTELQQRKVSWAEQKKVTDEQKVLAEKERREKQLWLDNNETESYALWEMIVLLIFGPILFFKPYIFNTHTLFNLRGNHYYLKFKQRLLVLTLSFMAWFTYINYDYKISEKKRLEEIDKIDISEWKEKFGYD